MLSSQQRQQLVAHTKAVLGFPYGTRKVSGADGNGAFEGMTGKDNDALKEEQPHDSMYRRNGMRSLARAAFCCPQRKPTGLDINSCKGTDWPLNAAAIHSSPQAAHYFDVMPQRVVPIALLL